MVPSLLVMLCEEVPLRMEELVRLALSANEVRPLLLSSILSSSPLAKAMRRWSVNGASGRGPRCSSCSPSFWLAFVLVCEN